jgi:hypothetical protein
MFSAANQRDTTSVASPLAATQTINFRRFQHFCFITFISFAPLSIFLHPPILARGGTGECYWRPYVFETQTGCGWAAMMRARGCTRYTNFVMIVWGRQHSRSPHHPSLNRYPTHTSTLPVLSSRSRLHHSAYYGDVAIDDTWMH